jgi:aspartyl-tRNA(Asn)/glutamyl-tRNA(Gln) amidotransferase subunit B
MFETGKDPLRIVEEKGLKQITDTGAIEAAVDQVISENPEQASEVSQGNGKAIGWFVGQVMQKTQGKANPQVVNKMLREKLGG